MKILKYIAASLLAVSLASCGDFLEETSQDTDYVKSWRDLNELLLGSAYLPVNGSSNFLTQANYGQFLHLVADEVEEQTTGTVSLDGHDNEFGYYTWQQRSGQNDAYTDYYTENATWTKLYNAINVCNNVIESVNDVPQQSDAEKQGALKVAGEAHFLRGLYYFWLANVYGQPYNPQTAQTDLGVPLKTTSEVLDIKFSRNTVQECYDQIEADLLAASQELGQYQTQQKSIYRADSTAVNLLLSRFYLYRQDWHRAAVYAQRVIDAHPSLQNLNSNNAGFAQSSNTETIFSMGGDDIACMLGYSPQALRVSRDQFSQYSTNDQRRSQWFWRTSDFIGLTKRPEGVAYEDLDRNSTRYYYYGYTSGLENSMASVSSLFWLRSAEAYLNLAEAEAYQGNDRAALAAINVLRTARFIPSASETLLTSTGTQLIRDIRAERRRELVLEGHRWFDLRRYRVCTVEPSRISITHDYSYYTDHSSTTVNETHRFVLTEDDKSWTLPIPFEVLNFNTGMEGNGNEWRNYTIVNNN